MNILLDTHSFLWFVEDNTRLSVTARSHIEDPANTIYLSVASVWEMAIKTSLEKLEISQPLDQFIPNQLILNNISVLEIAIGHAVRVATLPFHHRDPFDQLLAAQSTATDMPLISIDSIFDAYGVQRIW